MKEYIERDWLVKEAEAVLVFRERHYTDKNRIADAASTVEWLKYYAPAADVVEVVRCKDCKHLIEFRKSQQEVEKAIGVCFKRALYSTDRQYQCVTENDYCSCGAKMDKEE